MKKIKMFLAVVFLSPLLALASGVEGKVIEFCEEESRKITIAQVYNQMEKPISEAFKLFPKDAWGVVEYAYTWRVQESKEEKTSVINQFYNEAFLACISVALKNVDQE